MENSIENQTIISQLGSEIAKLTIDNALKAGEIAALKAEVEALRGDDDTAGA